MLLPPELQSLQLTVQVQNLTSLNRKVRSSLTHLVLMMKMQLLCKMEKIKYLVINSIYLELRVARGTSLIRNLIHQELSIAKYNALA